MFIGFAATAAGPFELPEKNRPPQRQLRLSQAWRLAPPNGERFDASGLLRLPEGSLLTLNDKRAGVYRIELPTSGEVAQLILQPGIFSASALDQAAGKKARVYDLEGLSRDAKGRLYTCDEASRLVFRYDPSSQQTDALILDWSPVKRWFSREGNASWEGIAIGGDQLFLANEREVGRIVVASLSTSTVTGSFSVSPPDRPARDIHYSDLCWYEDRLWVLCRESHCVLKVDPADERVEAVYGYAHIERDPKVGYLNPLPYGFVEGLALSPEGVWLAVDNNGIGRIAAPQDLRPSLWKCELPAPLPEKKSGLSRPK